MYFIFNGIENYQYLTAMFEEYSKLTDKCDSSSGEGIYYDGPEYFNSIYINLDSGYDVDIRLIPCRSVGYDDDINSYFVQCSSNEITGLNKLFTDIGMSQEFIPIQDNPTKTSYEIKSVTLECFINKIKAIMMKCFLKRLTDNTMFLTNCEIVQVSTLVEQDTGPSSSDELAQMVQQVIEEAFKTPKTLTAVDEVKTENQNSLSLVETFGNWHKSVHSTPSAMFSTAHDLFQLNSFFKDDVHGFVASGAQHSWHYFVGFNFKGLSGVFVCSNGKIYLIFQNINEWVMKLVLPNIYLNAATVMEIKSSEELKDTIDRLKCYQNTTLPSS